MRYADSRLYLSQSNASSTSISSPVSAHHETFLINLEKICLMLLSTACNSQSSTHSEKQSLLLLSQLQEPRSLLLPPVLGTSRLRVPLLLVLPLAGTDGGSAGNGLGAQVGAVTLLGGGVDDVLVEFAGRGGGGVGGCVVEFGGLVLLRGFGRYGDGVVVALDADGLE